MWNETNFINYPVPNEQSLTAEVNFNSDGLPVDLETEERVLNDMDSWVKDKDAPKTLVPDFKQEKQAMDKMTEDDWMNIPEFLSSSTDITQEQTQDEDEFWDELTGTNRKRKRVDVNAYDEMKNFKRKMTVRDLANHAEKFSAMNTSGGTENLTPIKIREFKKENEEIIKQCYFLKEYWSKNVERYTTEKNLEVIHEDTHVYVNIGNLVPENISQKLYYEMISSFDYQEWYEKFKTLEINSSDFENGGGQQKFNYYCPVFQAKFHFLTKEEALLLIREHKSNARFLRLPQSLQALKEKIEKLLEPGKNYFVRIGATSAKNICALYDNDWTVLNCPDARNILQCLISSMDVKKMLNSFFVHDTTYRTCPIVILPWKDIPKRSEFRCFIYNKKITAISQWWCYEEFDFQLQEKVKIQNAIQIFFEKIKEHTPYENCVMDVCCFAEQGIPVRLIEFNPWGGELTSGSGLFHWKKDELILKNEKSNTIVFKVLEKFEN